MAPLVFIKQTMLTIGTKKRRPPIKQELAVPTASACFPNAIQGKNQVIMPVGNNITFLR